MAWTIAWQLHLSNRWSKSSVAWQLAKGVTWTCVAVIYLLPRTESHPCPREADKVGGADFAGAGERQLLAHSYTATWGRETLCPDHPSCFFQAVPPPPRSISRASHYPSCCRGAVVSLCHWHTPGCPQAGQQRAACHGSAASPPAALEVAAAGASLLCFKSTPLTSRGMWDAPCCALVCLPLTPALVFSACVTVGTGTSIRCVQPGLLPLFQALWELAGEEKPSALRPAVCQVLLLLALLSSSHCTCLSPSQLLFSQPLQT